MSAQEGAFPQDVRRAAGHARALFSESRSLRCGQNSSFVDVVDLAFPVWLSSSFKFIL